MSSNSANVITLNNRTWKGFKQNCEFQRWSGRSKIAKISTLYQLVDTKTQKTWFIMICRNNKCDFIPTKKVWEEQENYGMKTSCTNFHVEPTWDGIFLPCSQGQIGHHEKSICWSPSHPMNFAIFDMYSQLPFLLNDIHG